jgi:hypothetical protein
MKTFGTLLLLILFHAAALPQSGSRFPYGMYIYQEHGIYLNGSAPDHFANARGENLLQFWRRVLGFNYFNITISSDRGTDEQLVSAEKYFDDYLWSTNSYLGKTQRKGYGLKDDLLRGDITLNLLTNCLLVISDGQYLLFIPSSPDNRLIFTKTPFTVDEASYTVSLPGNAQTAAAPTPLISNIAVAGSAEPDGKNFNRHIIRPRLNVNEKTHRAEFFVRLVITNSTTESTALTVRIRDTDSLYDARNQSVLDTMITIPKGPGPFTYALPFSLQYQNEKGSTIWSAYAFGLNLSVECSMRAGGSFQIKSVAIYDDPGKRAIEDPQSIPNYKSLEALLSRFAVVTAAGKGKTIPAPILELTDESVIANFAPMHAAASFIRKSLPGRLKIFATNPEIQTYAIDKRFLRETAVDYFGKDDYPVGPSFEYWRDIIGRNGGPSYFARLDSVQSHIAAYSPSTVPLSIVQLHSWDNQLREPPGPVIRSMVFISLLLNYKGIIYWYSGPEMKKEREALYKSTEIADTHGSLKPNYALYQYLFDSTNMVEYKKKTIQSISAFLNSQYTDNAGKKKFIGDLFYALQFKSPAIIGADGNPVHSFQSMGVENQVQVVKAEIVPPTLKTGSQQHGQAFIGIAYAQDQEGTYFFIPNLNEDGRASAVRLTFASSAKKKNLRILTLTSPGTPADKVPRNGSVVIPLPEQGAVMLEVQNAD